MKIGVSSWTWSWNIGVSGYERLPQPMDAMGLLQAARNLGAEVLQIADNLPLEKLTAEQQLALGRQANDWGIALEAGTKGVRRDALLPFLDAAERIGAKFVRTLLHDDSGCPTVTEAEEALCGIIPELKKRGMSLGVENHDFFRTAEIRDLVCRLNTDCIGVCLDPVNNFAQGESTREVLENLGAYTVNFHCKDYRIMRKPGGLGFDVLGCPAGQGMLDLQRCRAVLRDDISCVVELWTPWQGSIGETAALENRWAEKSVEYLRSVLD